ncbi:MAG TPA: hypothetical protein VHD31_02180 [Candidatus Paceibacterota bacterium]|nr:hypothetical protein [Candidatus Paceibacterota bacterium]
MKLFTHEIRGHVLFIFSFVVVLLAFIAVLGVSIFQGYIRWSLNQNFTLLGGWELEALTASAFALLFGLLYLHRTTRE